VGKTDPSKDAKEVLRRLQAIGVKSRLMSGNRCVLGMIPLTPAPFESLDGPKRFSQVIFTSVGRGRIKCLKPQALFHLPMIKITSWRSAAAIESRIRQTWQAHVRSLRDTRGWIESIGGECEVGGHGTLLELAIVGGVQSARASMIGPDRVILPSRGPLSGIGLGQLDDRCFRLDPNVESSVELEIAVSSRLEALQHRHHEIEETRRRQALSRDPVRVRRASEAREVRVLLVGPYITAQRKISESFRLRGYAVDMARNDHEAIRQFAQHSYELVLSDMRLGRNDGTGFVMALRDVPGVEDVPVVLIDESRSAASKQAARQVGAAGYMVRPIDLKRVSQHLRQLVDEPKRRRFTRFDQRVPITIEAASRPCLVTSLGRGGMFVATDDSLAMQTVQRCLISLTEQGRTLECDAEVIYRRGAAGTIRAGVGLRFDAFAEDTERYLIEYLASFDPRTKQLD
jgi:two-component system chemotaxis response regulator CheY